MTLKLYNTPDKQIEEFKPQVSGQVKIYTCGPTVYNRPHIGNLASYIYWDTLIRLLLHDGYTVDRVMNITDVGHLTSDADEGEDKLEKGARREGKTAWEIAKFYTDDFLSSMKQLNMIEPQHIIRATDYIPQQLELIRQLKQKGYTYQTSDGIYYDTSKFPTYADFAGLDLAAQKAGARVRINPEKRQPSDFALWKFTPAGQKRDMEWETPVDLLEPTPSSSSTARVSVDKRASASLAFDTEHLQPEPDRALGPLSDAARSRSVSKDNKKATKTTKPVMGFPGWHLECSTIALDILGPTLDIHTGGIDHIPVHHTNEIAQSEAVTGQRFSNYWLHNDHMTSNGTKISKSLNNGYSLDDLQKHGFSPLDFRMLVLQGHYRSESNFSFENLTGAKNRLRNWHNAAALRWQTHDTLVNDDDKDETDDPVALHATSQAVIEALRKDLNTPEALKIIDEAFSWLEKAPLDKIHRQSLMRLLETIDATLGLELLENTPDITDDAKRLILERQRARDNQDWTKSDQLRQQLVDQNIILRDTPSGSVWQYAD